MLMRRMTMTSPGWTTESKTVYNDDYYHYFYY